MKTARTEYVDFFKRWSPDVAYILGFIVADGNVRDGAVRIIISKIDIDVLHYIKEITKCRSNISNYKNDMVGLDFNSKLLSKYLTEIGIPPRKTGKEIIPIGLPDELVSHFVRGVFDGDGWIVYNKTPICGICSSNFEFLYSMRRHIGEYIGDISTQKTTTNKPFYHWNMRGTNAFYFRDFIYTDATFCLPRKRQVFNKIGDNRHRKVYQKWELDIIHQYKDNLKKISQLLKREEGLILDKMYRMGIIQKSRKKFTNDEISYMVSHYDKTNSITSIQNIARELQKSFDGVAGRLTKLGLRKKN